MVFNRHTVFKNSNLFFILVILFSSVSFFNCNDSFMDSTEEYQIIGRIISVESYNLNIAHKITLQSENDLIEEYFIQGYLKEFTPSHLREHMLTGEQVEIGYSILENKNIIIHIEDYQ